MEIDRRHKKLYPLLALLGVLCIAIALRLYGIAWGIPSEAHPYYSYHPDEALLLEWSRWLVSGNIIPKHFMYGGTLYYTVLNAFVYFGELLGPILGGINLLANSILFGRVFLVGVALITIVVVYECGRLLYGGRTGFLAALFLAVMPAHIVWAQRVRPDEIAALLVALILLASIKIMDAPRERLRTRLVYAGIAAGAAAALRLPLLVFAAMPMVALLMAERPANRVEMLKSLFGARTAIFSACLVATYMALSPHTLIYFDAFVAGLKVQWSYQSSLFPDAYDMGPGIYQYGWLMLHQALGYPLYFAGVIGVALALAKRTRQDILLLSGFVPYFVAITLTSWVVVRYTLPLLPLLALLAARLVAGAIDAFPRYKTGVSALAVLALLWTALADVAYLRLQAGKNVREIASEWIAANVSRQSCIVKVKAYAEDEFFNPPILDHYCRAEFYLSGDPDSAALFRDRRLDYLVLHEYFYKNMERLGSRHPDRAHYTFYEALQHSRYRLLAAFKQPVEVLGLDFSGSFASNDYTIVNPGIRIYKRE